jgi:hypothetical protein
MLAAMALLAAGCAMQATASPHAASSATASPHAVFGATSFVDKAGTGTVSFPDGNATLTPLAATGNAASGKVTATDDAGRSVTLVDGDTAYRAARAMIEGYAAGNLAGPVAGGLYSYYNSAYGQIQPDGTVKLTYQGTPVWLFTAPLIHHVDDSIVAPGNSPRATPDYTGCSYVAIVDAASGSLLTNWQHCTSS